MFKKAGTDGHSPMCTVLNVYIWILQASVDGRGGLNYKNINFALKIAKEKTKV